MLVPTRASEVPKTISADTALLLFSLQTPGKLPAFAVADLLADGAAALLNLLGEGVVEIDLGDGHFLSGAPALAALQDLPAPVGRSGELTDAALRYGSQLEGVSADELAQHLYRYHTVPLSPHWRLRLDEGRDRDFLGFEHEPGIGSNWTLQPDQSWYWFHPRGSGSEQAPVAKLYISPSADALPEVIPEVASVLAGSRAAQWKLGRGVGGVLRPDRIVAYFRYLDDLRSAIAGLGASLEGVAAHGVPFGIGVDAGGLLAWGVDPRKGSGGGPSSWRAMMCGLLAGGLIDGARQDLEPAELVAHSRRRLRAAGFDPQTLEPTAAWLAEAGGL